MLCYKLDKKIFEENRNLDFFQFQNLDDIDFQCGIVITYTEFISVKDIIQKNKNIFMVIVCIEKADQFKQNDDLSLNEKKIFVFFEYLTGREEFLNILQNISYLIGQIAFFNIDIKIFNSKLEIFLISSAKLNCIDIENNTCKGEFEDCGRICLVKNSSFNNNSDGKYELFENSFIRIYVKKIDKRISSLFSDYYVEISQNISKLFFDKDDIEKILADLSKFIYYSYNKREYINNIVCFLKKIFELRSIDFYEYGKTVYSDKIKKDRQPEDCVIDISFQEKKFGCFVIENKENRIFQTGVIENIRNIIFSGLNFFEQQENEKIYHQKIFQQEKMASLGQLYLGITHEINNPNTFIYGNSELIELYLDDINYEDFKKHDLKNKLENIKESVDEIKTGSERISNIVRNLKLLSRFDYSKISDVNLKDVILDAINVTNFNIKNNATIEFIYDEKADYIINGNYDEILQVFINTILNASQSFDEKRKIKDLRRFQGNICISLIRVEGLILIKIRDNGIGIEKEKLKKVFDPFFTTKSNAGTGLGLNIVYSILRKFGGEIRVESQFMDYFELIIELPSL